MPRSSLLEGLGTRLDAKGCVITDKHQRSSTPGLFAAGDIAQSLDQISVAMGQAAIAATTVHNILRGCPIPETV
jgi:thioredoxin reductase (NADPH)